MYVKRTCLRGIHAVYWSFIFAEHLVWENLSRCQPFALHASTFPKNTVTLCPKNAITAQWRIITFRMCRPPAINTLDCEHRSCPDPLDGAAITSSTPPSVQTLMCPRSGDDTTLKFTGAPWRQWMEAPLKAALNRSLDFCRSLAVQVSQMKYIQVD